MNQPRDRESVAQRRERIAALTKVHMPAAEIADMLGVSMRTVQRERRRLGLSVTTNRAPLTADEMVWAEELFNDGASRAEVARTLGVDAKVIRRRFPDRCWTRQEQAAHYSVIRRHRDLVTT